MKRVAVILILLACLAAPAFAGDWEFGAGAFPMSGSSESSDMEFGYVFHAAWTPAIFVVGIDAFAVPPAGIEAMTGSVIVDDQGNVIGYQPGYSRPGFVNAIDAGLQIELFGLMASLQVGVNNIYVYKQDELGARGNMDYGANLKLALGLKLAGAIRLDIMAVSIQSSFEDVISIFKGMASESTRALAMQKFTKQIVPAVLLVIDL